MASSYCFPAISAILYVGKCTDVNRSSYFSLHLHKSHVRMNEYSWFLMPICTHGSSKPSKYIVYRSTCILTIYHWYHASMTVTCSWQSFWQPRTYRDYHAAKHRLAGVRVRVRVTMSEGGNSNSKLGYIQLLSWAQSKDVYMLLDGSVLLCIDPWTVVSYPFLPSSSAWTLSHYTKSDISHGAMIALNRHQCRLWRYYCSFTCPTSRLLYEYQSLKWFLVICPSGDTLENSVITRFSSRITLIV